MPDEKGKKPPKPKRKHHHTACYDWAEVEEYVEKKHGIQLRGYKPEIDSQYRDFWHWLLKSCEIHRGCYFSLPEDYRGNAAWWQIEIMDLILAEFPELGQEDMWVDW